MLYAALGKSWTACLRTAHMMRHDCNTRRRASADNLRLRVFYTFKVDTVALYCSNAVAQTAVIKAAESTRPRSLSALLSLFGPNEYNKQ